MTIEINERVIEPKIIEIDIAPIFLNYISIDEVMKLTGIGEVGIEILEREKRFKASFPKDLSKENEVKYYLREDVYKWINNAIYYYLYNKLGWYD